MEPTVDTSFLLLAASCLVFVVFYRSTRLSSPNPKRFPFPPGPPREFIFGNTRQVPSAPRNKYDEWKKIYGDIIYTRLFNRHNVVINSYKMAKEAMDRAVYSDRYHTVIMDKMVGQGQAFAAINYGQRWKTYRRLMSPYMHKAGLERYIPVHRRGNTWYLQTLLDRPEDFMKNFKLKTAKNLAEIVYGITGESAVDEYIYHSEHVMRVFLRAILPGSFLVNIVPQLRYLPDWFPGTEFKRIAAGAKRSYHYTISAPVEDVKSKMAEGTAGTSITSDLLERGEDEDVIKKMNASIYGAAVDTTVSSMHTFMLAMTLHPEIAKKAQAELDAVVGPSRFPTRDDQVRLPYLNAVFLEVTRWKPPAALGIPHCLSEDDEFQGYFIPRGTIVYNNIWAMSRNEAHYEDPNRFWPERFLDPGLAPGKHALDPRLYIFGLGRRQCIGKHFAEASLFLTFASVLATFDIAKARDESGREIVPEVDFDAHLKPFKCSIKPRSGAAAALIRDAVAANP
ncbi:hypothetical protein BOTBODRAFT_34288 [Botryobasidium botryosum FD-172 SS1]|uniref:Cytochrome P450 n=1 Tax=Botryobasidium botryosum (strain FD-172 SS1) TaxID=930990 RepID=A0A067MLT5_BOTB1|nr:hypothetical protein BOTBODRAFT_34288 [Botryobasidium botryosum FD-172 SS1]